MADSEQPRPAPDEEPKSDATPPPAEPAATAADLTQADIDRMMAETAGDEARALIYRCTGEVFAEDDQPEVEPRDFSNPISIDEATARTLRKQHHDFAAFVSARLSMFLRMDFDLKLRRISTVGFKKFTQSVPNPSHVALFKMEPLAGVGVLDVDTQLGLAIVGRMLGGSGQAGEAPESLSEIEMNLLDDVLMVVLEEWCRVWGVDRRSGVSLVGRESGGRYLQSSASDTTMLVFAFEGVLGSYSERLQIAFPLPSLEAPLRRLAAARLPEAEATAPKHRAEWRPAFNSIPIPLSVEWDACHISLRDVVGLQPGSVVRMPREILNSTCVRLADVTKFVGEIGIEQERMAVRIDQKLIQEDV